MKKLLPHRQRVHEMCKQYPDVPTTTLTKMILKKYPNTFTGENHVRCSVRYFRGQLGTLGRKNIAAGHALFVKEADALPASSAKPWPPFFLPTDCNSIAVLSDIHLPYHDEEALSKAIDYIAKKKVGGILLNGDIWDCYRMSRFCQDPEARNAEEEAEIVMQFLHYLRKRFPKAKIWHKEGNHEERLTAYLNQGVPMWRKILHTLGWNRDADINSIPGAFGYNKLGIEWIDNRRIVKFDRLNIVHGHEWSGSGITVNPARSAFLKMLACVWVNHSHRTSSHSEVTGEGTVISTWSGGCLSDLHPHYNPINKYNHGFGIIRMGANGFEVENIKIIPKVGVVRA